jgi:segregation and condensation protein A
LTTETPFEDEGPVIAPEDRLVLDLDGFEGPIDLLLELSRQQKVDLTRISILELADQYLAFISRAHALRLEIAADYLVMAAWLAYLKSRLLLPRTEDDAGEEPSGEEMAAALAFQLRRLEGIRDVGARLMARPRLGVDVFARGAPEGITVISHKLYDVSLYELLTAYARQQRRAEGGVLRIDPVTLYTIDEAMDRLAEMLGRIPDWQTLGSFLPPELREGLGMRSAIASTLAASLELARTGQLELRQGTTFGPIYVRRARKPE